MTRAIIDHLTTDEKVRLLSGADVWRTAAIERVGLGSVKVTDGPNGARGDSTTGATALCLPAAIALGSSFDRDLVAELGGVLGRETVRKGAQVLLAPTINLARHPLGGRNFESFGEDPMLTAVLAVAFVDGVQSEGVAACGKHFVANDVEYARMTVSSEVDEPVLREVYLAPFEAIVEAGVMTLMASYPKLNGLHCTEHPWLLTTVLRQEWGFDGLVMSDWGATHHRSRPVLAGLDLEMPGPAVALGPNLAAAVADGEVPDDVLTARAGRVVELAERLDRIGRSADDRVEQSIEIDDERRLVRRAAADGMVLLTNDGTLPLAPDIGSLALIGPNATSPVIQGGGSAQVPAHRIVGPAEGLVDWLGPDRVTVETGCVTDRYLPPVRPEAWEGVTLELFGTDDLEVEPVETRTARSIGAFMHGGPGDGVGGQRWRGRLSIAASGQHRFGVLAVGRSRVVVNGQLVADNWTAPRPGDAFFQMASAEVTGAIELAAGSTADVVVDWAPDRSQPLVGLRFGHRQPLDEDALLEAAVVAAASADAAVVVAGLDNDWETEGFDRATFALPGRTDELVSRVAEVNERTIVVINAGGPVSMPWAADVAAILVAWYPGQEFGGALADVVNGTTEPGGRLPVTWPRDVGDSPFELPTPEPGPPRPGAILDYEEGLLIGHRSYDHRGVEPLAPFGFGLGYTTWDLGPASVEAGGDGGVVVRVPVTNSGGRDGKCVVQAYLDDAAAHPATDRDRPVRILAGFAAARLAAGARAEVAIEVPGRAFARWSDERSGWVEPAGQRTLHLGLSSRDLARAVTVDRS